jgi:hypothetical protein
MNSGASDKPTGAAVVLTLSSLDTLNTPLLGYISKPGQGQNDSGNATPNIKQNVAPSSRDCAQIIQIWLPNGSITKTNSCRDNYTDQLGLR